MYIIRLTFKISTADTYIAQWRKTTNTSFEIQNRLTFNVQLPGPTNTIDLEIDDPGVDWYFEIFGICAPGSVTPIKTGVVKAACSGVTLTAEYDPLACMIINDIVMTAQ